MFVQFVQRRLSLKDISGWCLCPFYTTLIEVSRRLFQNSPALLTTVTALHISSPDHYIVRRSFCKETPEGLQKVLGGIETERSKARLSLFARCDLACILHSSYDLASLILHAS